MALPRPNRPEYSTTVPSTGKKIKYQPFSVREEKVLILAASSEVPDEIANAVTNCLKRCITSPTDFDVSELALFDIEYLFLKCRAKSVGEKLTVRVTDPNDSQYTVSHDINIDKISVQKTEGHTDLIEINDDISIKMRYPDISFFSEGIQMNSIESSINMVSRCVKQILIDDEVYNQEDMTTEEIVDWLEELTQDKFTKITDFFTTMPRLKHTINLKNPNTNDNFVVNLEGLADFF